jgi:hypothetical protein
MCDRKPEGSLPEMQPFDTVAAVIGCLIALAGHDALWRQVVFDDDPRPEKRLLTDLDATFHPDFAGKKATVAQARHSPEPDLGRDEAVVADDRMMTKVIAAPNDDAGSNLHERLDHIILENDAILSDLLRIDMRVRVDKRCELIAPRLAFEMPFAAKIIQSAI